MMQFDGPSQDDGLLASPPQQAGKFNTLFRKTSFRLLLKKNMFLIPLVLVFMKSSSLFFFTNSLDPISI